MSMHRTTLMLIISCSWCSHSIASGDLNTFISSGNSEGHSTYWNWKHTSGGGWQYIGAWMIDPTAADSPQTHRLVNRSADAPQSTGIGKSSSESDALRRGDVLPTIESSPPREETLQNTAAPEEPYSTRESEDPSLAGDPAPAGEVPIGVLLNSVVDRLGVDGHDDLLRFILDEEIKESGLDSDAARSIETAILEVAGARGDPSEVRSGVSDIQCTASLCTFLVESGGPFQMTRMSPEFQAMLEQGPVSMVWWVRLGTRERQGHVRLYVYRPGIEQHWGLLEAVLAGP